MKIVWNHLNLVTNRTTGFAPIKLIDNRHINDESRTQIYNNQIGKAHKEYEKQMNKETKQEINFKSGDKIFIKNQMKDKLDKYLIGPFRIYKTGKNLKRIQYKDGTSFKWIGIRKVVPSL